MVNLIGSGAYEGLMGGGGGVGGEIRELDIF